MLMPTHVRPKMTSRMVANATKGMWDETQGKVLLKYDEDLVKLS